jgi:hypothetical protein
MTGAAMFSCYLSLTEISDKPLTFAGKKAGIEYVTDFSFDLVTKEGIRRCTVPSSAMTDGVNSRRPGRYVTVSLGKDKYYLDYGADTAVVDDYRDMPKDTFKDAACDPPSTSEQKWLDVFGKRISDKKSECGSDAHGMGVDAGCVPHLIDTLKKCESAGGRETTTYFSEVRRSAEAHSAYKAGDDAGGRSAGDAKREK